MAHFDYVNPDAPKGGTARVSAIGAFNNLNSFVDKGTLAGYIDPRVFSITHERLMMQSDDDLATYYGRLAKTIEVADDYSRVAYTLRRSAYWHDGVPITMDDVLWTIDTYKNKASINNLMVNRLRTYDFDATIRKFYTFNVPFPARLHSQYTSQYAHPPNMTNYAGIKNPAIDFLVEKIASATTEAQMNTAGRALDQVLSWNFYVITECHPRGRHACYWDRFGHPPIGAEYMRWSGFPNLWWIGEEKNTRVNAGLAAMGDD